MDNKISLDLVVPGLLAGPQSLDLADLKQLCPALLRALRSGVAQPVGSRLPATPKDLLSELFACEFAGSHLPAAALSHCFSNNGHHNEATTGWAIFADPLHLRPDRDRLVCFNPASLNIQQREAMALCQSIEQAFQDESWRLQAITPNSWCLQLNEDPQAEFIALHDMLATDIGQCLPTGPHGRRWQSYLNEIQMLLHEHPVNLARESQALPTINSVWFWGAGSLGQIRPQGECGLQAIWCNDPVVGGLAKWRSIETRDLPVDAELCLSQLSATGGHFLLWLDFLSPGETWLEEQWRQNLQHLEQLWLQPLIEALRQGRIGQLRLRDEAGRTFLLDQSALKKWWQRLKPLSAYR